MRVASLCFFLIISFSSINQILSTPQDFTKKDSLRGGLRPERESFNVLHYDLNINVDPNQKYISGSNTILFSVEERTNCIQLDLYSNLTVDSIIYNQKKLNYTRKHNAIFVDLSTYLKEHDTTAVTVYYQGNPIVAKKAPWEGGFVFNKDHNGKPWIGVAVQGDGASLWYPNKDHLSDEPDFGADIHITVPQPLMNISNGRLIETKTIDSTSTEWHWRVESPINNYNITLNIGDYVHFSDTFQGLSLDYFVLRDHHETAKKHFKQVPIMLDCFHEKLGYYPFPKDGYKLIETPYLGMEHQSAIAYGNQFKQGYLGTDLSGTGHGLYWDFIIIHESGHEWFGNSISASDIADLWIHESFTTYTEAIFIECTKGKQTALEYLKGIRRNITNERPMIGNYGVNHSGPSDVYYKGANMLATIRSVINDDDQWWKTLKAFTSHFHQKVTNSAEVISFFSDFNSNLEVDLRPIFEHYLFTSQPPILKIRKKGLFSFEARWENVANNFEMPIVLYDRKKNHRVILDHTWKKIPFKSPFKKEINGNDLLFYYEK